MFIGLIFLILMGAAAFWVYNKFLAKPCGC